MDSENKFSRRTNNRILSGVILVVIGAGLLLRNLGFPVPEWLFTWPMLLIVIGIYSGFKHSFRNNSWIVLIGIGSFFLVDEFIPDLRLHHLFWPAIIIGLGILFILRPRRRSWHDTQDDDAKSAFRGSGFIAPASVKMPGDTETDGNDSFNIHSVFSGVKKTVLSKDFKGGSISCVFGGAELDLTQADITGKVVIRIEEVFGGTKLIVPPDWIVQNEIDGIFHGVEDKRKYNTSATVNSTKILVLRGTCVFAGIEVRSY